MVTPIPTMSLAGKQRARLSLATMPVACLGFQCVGDGGVSNPPGIQKSCTCHHRASRYLNQALTPNRHTFRNPAARIPSTNPTVSLCHVLVSSVGANT